MYRNITTGAQAWAQAEARWALGLWATRPGTRSRALRHGTQGVAGSLQAGARGTRHGGTARELGPWPGRAAGPVGCALGALSLFSTRFDSVLFLSQFLDIVREPGL